MFDVTAEDLSRLNDEDARTLVARLCEEHLRVRGLSTARVTWGGDQRARDGGVDVRVGDGPAPAGDDWLPRRSIAIQVKAEKMPASKIAEEMRPGGVLRPMIAEQGGHRGAYIICSTRDSASDSALSARLRAMRMGMGGLNTDIHLDFYDGRRLATWLREHPSLILWVHSRLGRRLHGWQPFAPWSNPAEQAGANYLADDELRLQGPGDNAPTGIAEGLDRLRGELREPRKCIRLVGLSGVGKTRFAQALFEDGIGTNPLPQALAIYTDLGREPSPPPLVLATELVAQGRRAVFIVDNCGADLHRHLAALVGASDSKLSLLTIEYDVQDDLPERTAVFKLEPASTDLMERLLAQRYRDVSAVDGQRIASLSGGNARIAVSLAESVRARGTAAELTDRQLFARLFHQGRAENGDLLRAARACALIYSFEGRKTGPDSELARIARLAEQSPQGLYANVAELRSRQLVQSRGDWRALLPHGIANRLASEALEAIPPSEIEDVLIAGGRRLARSFSRRLHYLHDSPAAVALIRRWLSHGGVLGDVHAFDDVRRQMFLNIAPVDMEATLAALERACPEGDEAAARALTPYAQVVRSLAYEPALFDRAAMLMARIAAAQVEGTRETQVENSFKTLFQLALSGTHASAAQRARTIEILVTADDERLKKLGLGALEQFLKGPPFIGTSVYEFGAHRRDYGYRPRTTADSANWLNEGFKVVRIAAKSNGNIADAVRAMVARQFRTLWQVKPVRLSLIELMHTLSGGQFWRSGWLACRSALHYDYRRAGLPADDDLKSLAADLAPKSLPEHIDAVVLMPPGDCHLVFIEDAEEANAGESYTDATKAGTERAGELAREALADRDTLRRVCPDLARGGTRVWHFGRTLAEAAGDPLELWSELVDGYRQISPDTWNSLLLEGYLVGLAHRDFALADIVLDRVLADPRLSRLYAALQGVCTIDSRALSRLMDAVSDQKASMADVRQLAYGDRLHTAPPEGFAAFLRELASKGPEGVETAWLVLSGRIFADERAGQEHAPELRAIGTSLLSQLPLRKSANIDVYRLSEVARIYLPSEGGDEAAFYLASKIKHLTEKRKLYSHAYESLLSILLSLRPEATLAALFPDDLDEGSLSHLTALDLLTGEGGVASLASAIPESTLLNWCKAAPERRFRLAADFVNLFDDADDPSGHKHFYELPARISWNSTAIALLEIAPDQPAVFRRYVSRFRPSGGWGGSLAVILQRKADRLDDLLPYLKDEAKAVLPELRASLDAQIAEWRTWEEERSRSRDETFESPIQDGPL